MAYINESFYKITGTFAASQFPDVEVQQVKLRTPSTNVGSIYIGGNASDTWFELDAGVDTGWFNTTNLNNYWQSKSSGTTDYIVAWVQR